MPGVARATAARTPRTSRVRRPGANAVSQSDGPATAAVGSSTAGPAPVRTRTACTSHSSGWA
jgi:hypothetical protein